MKLVAFLLLPLIACNNNSTVLRSAARINSTPESVGEIPLPPGYNRIQLADSTFGRWLRNIKLKKDKTVYLYNGAIKKNQDAQVAVLDVSTGNKDLQQCADAIIRLRAEYLKSIGNDVNIAFHATDGTLIDYSSWKKGYRFVLMQGRLVKQRSARPGNTRASFEKYLETVFAYCSTRSLVKELRPVKMEDVMPGDVLIQGGAPGHAALVIDIANNKENRKRFLLAQSYMPAQDIHILKNPMIIPETPWFTIPSSNKLYTPEWIFSKNDLRRFVE